MAAADTVDVAVLGAGVAGSAVSYHLARRHAGSLVLIDPSTPAAGATGRAAGIVTDQLWNLWDVQVAQASQREYAELCGRHDPSAYTVNGFLRWTSSPVAAAAMEHAAQRLQGWGVPVEPVGPSELAAALPWGQFDDVRLGLRGSRDAVVTPSTLATIYVQEAQAMGAETSFGVPIASVRRTSMGAELEVGGRLVRARSVVVAAGAWSKRLLAAIGRPLPLVPYRTQAATLRPAAQPPLVFPSGHDIDSDVYFRPEGPGRVLAGNGTESVEADPDRFAPQGDDRFLVHLAESFAGRLPGWATCERVRAWAGVCTATPDRRPLVGAVPEAEGWFVITGFNGFGVMRAGGAAQRLVARMVDGPGEADEPLEPVRPDRFRDAPLSFRPRPGFTLEDGDDPRF